MNNFFAGAEVITVFSLQDALEEGVILCLSDKEEHAKDRWLPILQHGAANHRGFRGDAVAAEGLWLFRRLDRQ